MRFLLVHIVRTVPFRLGLPVATTNSTLPSTSDPLSTIIEAFQECLTKLIESSSNTIYIISWTDKDINSHHAALLEHGQYVYYSMPNLNIPIP